MLTDKSVHPLFDDNIAICDKSTVLTNHGRHRLQASNNILLTFSVKHDKLIHAVLDLCWASVAEFMLWVYNWDLV